MGLPYRPLDRAIVDAGVWCMGPSKTVRSCDFRFYHRPVKPSDECNIIAAAPGSNARFDQYSKSARALTKANPAPGASFYNEKLGHPNPSKSDLNYGFQLPPRHPWSPGWRLQGCKLQATKVGQGCKLLQRCGLQRRRRGIGCLGLGFAFLFYLFSGVGGQRKQDHQYWPVSGPSIGRLSAP